MDGTVQVNCWTNTHRTNIGNRSCCYTDMDDSLFFADGAKANLVGPLLFCFDSLFGRVSLRQSLRFYSRIHLLLLLSLLLLFIAFLPFLFTRLSFVLSTTVPNVMKAKIQRHRIHHFLLRHRLGLGHSINPSR